MIGWRGHLGKVAPAPAAGRVIREFYDVVPDGVDITVASLTVQRVDKKDMDEMMTMVDRAAELLAEKGCDGVFVGGVPPFVMKGPVADREVIARLEKITGKPCSTDISAVMDAFAELRVRRIVMAAPFQDWVNDLIKIYMAASDYDIVHMKGIPLASGSERRALPIEVEYTFTRQVFGEYQGDVDAIYIPCGGWGTVYNVARLEQDLGKPVITWFTAMIWWFLKTRGVKAPIRGFGSLLESLSA